jgi:hypothetical protein
VLSNLSFDCSREKMTKDDYRILQVQKDEQHIFDKREIQG